MKNNENMDFHFGYLAAMEDVYNLLTAPGGRTEAYENTLECVKNAVGK